MSEEIISKLKKRFTYQSKLNSILHYYNYHYRKFAWSEKAFSLTDYAIRAGIISERAPLDSYKLKMICAKKDSCPAWLCESALHQLLEDEPDFDIDDQYIAIAWIEGQLNNNGKGRALRLGDHVDSGRLQKFREEVKEVLVLEKTWALSYRILDSKGNIVTDHEKFPDNAWKKAAKVEDIPRRKLPHKGYELETTLVKVKS